MSEKLCPIHEWKKFVDKGLHINSYTAKICDECKEKRRVFK